MLADGEQLPIILLPDSLLDAARNIVRSSFVTVVKKRVYTLACSRAASADQRYINMMENALRSKGVMITTPTSTKSILLKFLENVFTLNSEAERHATRQRNLRTKLAGPPPIEMRARRALEAQTQAWADILLRFQGSVLIMDELVSSPEPEPEH